MATVTVLPTAAGVESDERHVVAPTHGKGASGRAGPAPTVIRPVRTGVGVAYPQGDRRPTRTRVVVRRRPAGGIGPRPVACDQSYESDLHGSRLTTRGKVVVAALWLTMLAAIGFMVVNPASVPKPADTTTVVVTSGDTLWEIAEGLVPGVDRRETITQIMELNGLVAAGDIRPGDVLVVPAVAQGGGVSAGS